MESIPSRYLNIDINTDHVDVHDVAINYLWQSLKRNPASVESLDRIEATRWKKGQQTTTTDDISSSIELN